MTPDAGRYLQRIGHAGALDPEWTTLRSLHVAHLRHVPFENLDIPLCRPIQLDQAHLFAKIVTDRRGGFCYELNGLFAWLLAELGFRATLLSARVARPDGTFSPEFDHLVLRVDLPDGRPAAGDGGRSWIADVGFGDSFLEPVPLAAGRVVEPAGQAFRLVEATESRDGWCLERRDGAGAWRPQYAFTLRERMLGEFDERCLYQQRSPESHFTQHAMATVVTPDGRITVSDARVITTRRDCEGGACDRRPLRYASVLDSTFGIVLPDTDLRRLHTFSYAASHSAGR